jgi:hypothetical protein
VTPEQHIAQAEQLLAVGGVELVAQAVAHALIAIAKRPPVVVQQTVAGTARRQQPADEPTMD